MFPAIERRTRGHNVGRRRRNCCNYVLVLCLALPSTMARFMEQEPQHRYTGADVQAVMAKLYSLQHQHLWQTLDGTRPYLDHLKNLKQENWQAPPPERDTSDNPVDTVEQRTSRCAGTLGSWCGNWWSQDAVPSKPPKRGNKTCANNCNNVGVCNHDIGICQCPVGWQGDDCMVPRRRPCTHRFANDDDPVGVPVHHMDENMHDLNLNDQGWTASRCSGRCDDRLSGCYCGYNSTYAHIPAPKGSPVGTPPIRMGRPMHDGCKAITDNKGKKNSWGVVPWEHLYGPSGWCQAEIPASHCGCPNEDMSGHACQGKKMVFCPNQCNARGECLLGFCKCDPGWYGTSCDKKKAGEPIEPVNVEERLGRNADLIWREPFQRAETPARPTRKRPLIYVYDLPSDYNAKILGYRLAPGSCIWRGFGHQNETSTYEGVYVLETMFHDVMLSSPHRTLDPDEADFFYMPMYLSCYVWPVLGWADGPWYYAPSVHPRPMHQMHMALEAKRWVQQHYPYWNRSEGRDHVFLMTHDEGPCYLPTELYENAIILHHWGRTDPDHTSGSAWPADNYTWPLDQYPKHQPYDWREKYKGHACYTPGKDLLVPALKQLHNFVASPLMGHMPFKRDILFFFRADVGLWREWWYSRGIRQSLFRLAQEDKWREKYQMVIGMRETYPGDYSTYLARSKFCLVAMGDGWSARSEDAILHGCIPVIINDNVHPVLHGVVDWSKIGIRVPQARMQDLPKILLAIPDTQVRAMQKAISRVWTRFVYTTHPLLQERLKHIYNQQAHTRNASSHLLDPNHPLRPLSHFPARQDAFHTIMHWLYSRIGYARGEATLL